jgi:integrase
MSAAEAVQLSGSRLSSVLEDKNLARRRFQSPSVLQRTGKQGPEWFVRYRVDVIRKGEDGKPAMDRREKHVYLGLVKDMSKRQAERKRDELLREVNGQVYQIQSHIPWPDFCAIFRERHLPKLAVPTQNTYKQILSNYIEPAFAAKQLYEITSNDCDLMLNSLELANLSKWTVRKILSSTFKRALSWGYLKGENPVQHVEMPSRSAKYEKKILTPEELQKLLLAVRPDVKLIIETLVWTGMRISECLGLKWEYVNLEAGYVRIEKRDCRGDRDKPKTPKSRRVLPLGHLVAEYRQLDHSSKDAYVFQRNGEPYSDCELLSNYLAPIMRKLGIKHPGAGFHQFRRLLATWMDQGGADLSLIQQQLGHSSRAVTENYILSKSLGPREEFIKKLQEAFAKGMNPGGTVQ